MTESRLVTKMGLNTLLAPPNTPANFGSVFVLHIFAKLCSDILNTSKKRDHPPRMV